MEERQDLSKTILRMEERQDLSENWEDVDDDIAMIGCMVHEPLTASRILLSSPSLANVESPNNSNCPNSASEVGQQLFRRKNKAPRVKTPEMTKRITCNSPIVATNATEPVSTGLRLVPDEEQFTDHLETDLTPSLPAGSDIQITESAETLCEEGDVDLRQNMTSVTVGTQTDEAEIRRTAKICPIVDLPDSDEEMCEPETSPLTAMPTHSSSVSSSCHIPEVSSSTTNVFSPSSQEVEVDSHQNQVEVFGLTTQGSFKDSVDPKSIRPQYPGLTTDANVSTSLNTEHSHPHTAAESQEESEEGAVGNLLPEYGTDDITHIPDPDDNLLQSIAGDWDDPADNSEIFPEDEREQNFQGLEELFMEADSNSDPLCPETSSPCPSLKPDDEEDMEEEKESYVIIHRITVTIYKCNICLRYDFTSEKEFVNHFTKDHEILYGLQYNLKSCPSDEEFDLEQEDVDRYEQLIQKPVPGRVYLPQRRPMQDSEESDSEWEDIPSDNKNNTDSDGSSAHLDDYESSISSADDTTTDDDSDFEIDTKSRIKVTKKSKTKTRNSQLQKIPVAQKIADTKVVQTTRRSKAQRSKTHARK